jgi:aminoglycoside phosphotransferase (APT) family kinase protein
MEPLLPIELDIRRRDEARLAVASPFSQEQVAAAFRAICPGSGAVIAVAPAPQAFGNDVWLVDAVAGRFVLRVARRPQDLAGVANAVEAQRLASAAGILVPHVLAHDDGAVLSRPLLVQEWLPGEDGETAWTALGAAERDRFARDFGRALARVHAIPGPCFSDDVRLTEVLPDWPTGLRSYLARYAARLRATTLLPRATLDAAIARLEAGVAALSPAIRPALTHWDMWLANTLVSAGTFAGLLDWDSAAFSDPLVDFVKLEVWVFERHPEIQRPFLASYWSAARRPPDAEQRLDLYRGLEYLTHTYFFADWGGQHIAAAFRARLERWLEGGPAVCDD